MITQPVAGPAAPDGRAVPEDRSTDRVMGDLLAGITDPVVYFRVFAMLVKVERELGRQDLDQAARTRAATLLREARKLLGDAVSGCLVAELDRVEPALGDQPTTAELRLAYSGMLAWLASVDRMAVEPTTTPPRQAGELEHAQT